MTDDALDHYRRMLAAPAGTDALCVTYARGIGEAALITAFGGDPAATMTRRDLSLALDRHHYSEVPPALLVTTIGEWAIGIEENGYQGSRSEVLRRAGTDAAVSVYWNINAASSFSYVIAGRTTAAFDMLAPERRHGLDPQALDEYGAGQLFGDEPRVAGAYAAGLTLAERVTGVRLPADLLDRELRGAILAEVPQDIVPEFAAGHPALDDPFIAELVADPAPGRLGALHARLARIIAEDAGIATEPAVRAALDALDAGTPPPPGLAALREHYAAATRPGDVKRRMVAMQRLHAVSDIASAFEPARYMTSGYGIHERGAFIQAYVIRQCELRAMRPPT